MNLSIQLYGKQVKSRCSERHTVIVSKEKKNGRCHCAINDEGRIVFQAKLDKDVFPNSCCCDFLVLETEGKRALFIELKGRDVNHALEQLDCAATNLRADLVGYTFHMRVICSGTPHALKNTPTYLRFVKKHSKPVISTTMRYEERLSDLF